jgi:hypothetical protein
MVVVACGVIDSCAMTLTCKSAAFIIARMGMWVSWWVSARARAAGARLAPGLLMLAVGCQNSAQTSPNEAPKRAAPAPQHLASVASPGCPLELKVAVVVNVRESSGEQPLCEPAVSMTDEAGKPLPLERAPDGCSWMAYGGWAGRFTVSATMPGYDKASTYVVMAKEPCGFSAPEVTLKLTKLKG